MFRASNEVKKPGQGPHARRQPTSRKPWWVCLMATLTFCLWGANVLPIQQIEYQLTTNLAISQHRMPMLQRVARNAVERAAGTPAVFSALEIQSDATSPSASANSDLRSVRVKIRCPIHCDIHDVEQSLSMLTAPSSESAECSVFAKQLLKEQWLLESSSHSMKRLALDLERERNAIETDSNDTNRVASQETGELRISTPFRLTSFESRQQPNAELMEKMRQLNQTRTENIASMLLTLERLKANARGFLSLTGSPRMNPVVRPLTVFRFLVLCVLCASVWLILNGWLNPVLGRRLFWQKRPQFIRNFPEQKLPASEISASEINKAIRWMQREGIPYLGAIQVGSEEDNFSNEISDTRTAEALSAMPAESSTSNLYANQLLKNLSEGSLVLWIGLFAARLMFDPLWRELIAVAPLAAISRMISGIQ